MTVSGMSTQFRRLATIVTVYEMAAAVMIGPPYVADAI